MQQESTKKNKKLIWLIAALAALLVVVGVVLAIFLMPGGNEGTAEPTGPVGGRPELYWNVDRETYLGNAESAGLSTREPGEDGLYHLRFAYNGELVEYTVADKRLVNVIDNNQVLGLVLDDNGNIIDAINPTTIATEVAKDFVLQRIQADSLTLNSSIAMNGMEMPVKLSELTQIYDVRNDAPVIGAIAEPELMDKVIVYANDKGEVTHIYIVERQPAGIVGWRVDRKQFDTKTQHSTRKPDENGIWNITISVDGKHEVFKCKDQAIVDDIDKRGTYVADLAIRLDDDGYICEVMEPSVALRGKLAGASYHITSLDGNQFTATKLLSGKDTGKTFSGTITENTKIFNVCYGGTNTYIGEPTQLQNMDRVIAYTDLEGNPLVIFVTFRMVDGPVAYNRVRMYDAAKLETSRTPVNGYYVFEVAIEGKVRTVRTKDKALATKIDAVASQLVALKLNGDIIEAVYDVHRVCGDDTYGAGGRRFVVDQTGVILSWVTVGYDFNAPTNLVMKPDVQIYDVTGYPGSKFGAPTELQIGDMVRPMVDYNSNITHLFVVSRCSNEPLYYNLSRQYDTVKAETTRKQDENGYYVFKMASRGKEVTVKTKSKEMADFMDMQYAPVMSLKVDKNGIVKMAYPADSAYKFGYKTANWNWFVKYNEDGTITTKSYDRTVDYSLKVADDVKIYNVSTIFDKNKGEAIKKLMPNDLIQAVAVNDTKEIKEIYVITRQLESKFYYNISRMYNTVTKETTRVPDAEGYYVFDLSVEGQTKQFKTKDKAIATTIDSYGYVPFGMQVSGDIIKRAFSAGSIYGVKTTAASNYDVTKIKGNEATLTCYLPTNAKVGDQIDIKLAPNYKAYNVSSYAEPFGGKVKLGLGDRAIYYTNMDGEVEWVYIWYKNTHQKGHISYCEHCNKNVYWQPYTGAAYATDAHVYVTHDRTVSQANISSKEVELKDRPELVVDLNGKTVKATGRAFLTYGTLSIVDTVGGGKLVGGNTATKTEQALMSSTGGVINLYSGTITRNPDNKACSNGGVVFVGADSTFNMYGGTIEGGYATAKGGNVYNALGTFNMYGGTITGGVNGAGKNLYVGGATFNMEGGTIDGDIIIDSKAAKVTIGGNAQIPVGTETGLKLSSGVVLDLSQVTENTKVAVDAAGVFTKENVNISNYLNNFTAVDPAFPVSVMGNTLVGGIVGYCGHCQADAFWGKFSASSCSGKNHLIVTEDVTLDSQIQIGASGDNTADVVIDLNGHTITANGDGKGASTGRAFLTYGALSILDNSAEGKGKILSTQKGLNQGGVIMIATIGKLNLYDGEITLAEGASARRRGGTISVGGGEFNMYGGKVSGGRISDYTDDTSMYSQGGNLYMAAGGRFNMYGGELVNGANSAESFEYLLGGNIGASTGSTINIYGGTIVDGSAEIGGNIWTGGKLNMLGGEVKNGNAVVTVTEKFNGETGETTKTYGNGVGGNIYVDSGAAVVIGQAEGTEKATVTGGIARTGGNIYVEDTKTPVVIEKNAVVENGKAVSAYYISEDNKDEKYNGGNIYMLESTKVTIKGTVTGGHAWQGGNIAANGLSTVTIDGGTVSGGTIDGWNGGNIQSNNGVVKLMNKATVSGGKANRYRGGNIYAGGGAELYISDSTVNGGSAWQGGNIFISGRAYASGEETKYDYGILEVTDSAVIDGGIAHITDSQEGGGNICALGVQITVNGSTIENGISKSCGGNIFANYLSETYKDFVTTITMDKDAKVLGGESQITKNYNGGGNIYAKGDTVIECAGTIADGKAGRYGGNVMLSRADLILLDGAKVENGTATAVSGGNICKFNYGMVDIQAGATVSGGTAADESGNIFISGDDGNGVLNIAGTVTDGAVLIYNNKVDTTVSGAAKVDYLKIASGVKINLGELTEGADIKVSANGVFTNPNEKASYYEGYFSDAKGALDVKANAANELVFGITKYCEHCGEDVLFGAFTAGSHSASTHMIVTEDVLLDTQLTIGSSSNKGVEVVVDLNGHTVKANSESTSEYKRFALVYGKLFIQDGSTEQTGKIIGQPTTQNAGTIMLATGGEMTQYGGEISVDEGYAAAKSGGTVSVGAGKFTMHGGKIIGGLVKDNSANLNYTANMGGAVYVSYGSFVMNGGEIVGGAADASATKPLYGGAICVEQPTASVTINSGTVTGGKAVLGGAIYTAGTLTINGGTITGGEALSTAERTGGGNIYAAGAKIIVNGGVIEKGVAACGGNIFLADRVSGETTTASTLTVAAGAIIRDGVSNFTTGQNGGGNIFATGSAVMTVSGTISNGQSARWGGNVMLHQAASLTLADGAVVENGKSGSIGGNIMTYGSGNLNVQAGATLKGGNALNTTDRYGSGIYASMTNKLYIAGTVENSIDVDSSASAKVTVSGAAKISKLVLPDAAKYDITLDNLTEGASIKVSTNGAFTVANENAADYAKYFSAVAEGKGVTAVGNILYVGDVKACEHCGEGKTAVWIPFDKNLTGKQVHMYLTADVKLASQLGIGAHTASNGACTDACNHDADVVIDLAGYDVTLAEPTEKVNYTRFALVYGKLSIMDSSAEGTGTITATAPLNGGVVLLGAKGGLNLYGGELTHSGSATKSGGIVSVGANTFNMYGGKLTGGKLINATGDYKQNQGGSVYVTTGTFNMYGGSIEGGKLGAEGQKDLVGGNIYSGGGTINIQGGTISGGDGYVGGNVYSYAGKVTIKNATISNGTSTNSGANVYVEGKCDLTIDGATITGGVAANRAGNICVTDKSTAKISNATISDGSTVSGGNLYVSSAATVTVENTTISGGTATGNGGNIYVNGATDAFSTLNVIGGVIENGKSTATSSYTGGGNLYATYSDVTITGTTVQGGEADQCGGNLYANRANLTLGNGTVVNGGKIVAEKAATGGHLLGASICKFNSGNLDIQAGATVNAAISSQAAVYMSDSSKQESNLSIAGTVNGTVSFEANVKSATLSGAVKIARLNVPANYKVVLGDLTEGADVKVSGNGVFTNENEKAAEYVGYFSAYSATTKAVIVVDKTLYLADVKACAHCGEGKSAVWAPFSTTTAKEYTHLVVTEDTKLASQLEIAADKDLVIDLNGKTVSGDPESTSNYKRFALVYGKLSIMDSSAEKTGKIVAYPTTQNAGALMITGAGEVTQYGGEITIAEGTAASKTAGVISVGGAKYYMKGGKITGGKLYDNSNGTYNNGGTIYVTTGTFEMTGGEIIGGALAEGNTKKLLGGAIYSGGGNIVLKNGTITGGTAYCGGVIYAYGGKVEIENTTISGGSASTGGNIYVEAECQLTINGATISGGNATGSNGGNILATGASVANLMNTTVSGGTAKASGGNIYVSGKEDASQTDGYKYGSLTIVGGSISGGESKNSSSYTGGGNIYLSRVNAELENVTVENGVAAKSGGNILADHSDLILKSGALVQNPTATQLGGNICKFNTGKLEIQAGAVVSGAASGVAADSGKNVWINNAGTLVVAGTVTGGELRIGNNKTNATISGTAKIDNLSLYTGVTINLGELTEGASIGVSASGVFTNGSDKAAEYLAAGYFTAVDTTKKVDISGDALTVVAAQ